MSRNTLILTLAGALFLPMTAFAQSDTATDLDQVVVTATRTQVPIADSLFPVQVIDREQIERSQVRDLPDLLRGRAGIDIGNQGGPGKLSTVFLRGTESDHVLVLVDGVRVGSATAGLVAFQDIPVEQIERIEIVRGPRSSLYGSEAIGGVIQIFTRRDTGKLAPRLRVGIGSHGLREASAGIGGGSARGWFGIDIAHQRSDGINACNGSAALFTGCYVDEPDRDGYRNNSLNLRGGVTASDTLRLEANVLRADSFNEFDGSIYGGNEADNAQQVLGTKLLWSPSKRLDLTAQLGRADDKSRNRYNDHAGTRADVGYFDTRRYTASLQADYALARDGLLTLGSDWQRDHIGSDTPFDVTSRDNTAVFAEYQGKFGKQQLHAGVRSDDNQQFGRHTTGSAGWGVSAGHGLHVSATLASGFKAPSFNDLYYPFFGKADLRPETSCSGNLGIAQYTQHWNWTLNIYETRVDDLISYDSSIFLPNNIDKARIRGAEFTVDTTLAGWDISTQLSHTDPRNRSGGGGNDGKLLARRARNSGRIDLDRAFGAWRVGGTLNAAGARFDDAANNVRLGGYATFTLRLAYAINPAWTLQARASNLFDRDYQTVDWYNQPGREYALSVRWQPR